MNLKTNLIITLLLANLFADSNFIKPDSFNNQGHCIVQSQNQKYLGLLRFNSKDQFSKLCNGIMIFQYENDQCRVFTMKNMKFNIFIQDKFSKKEFLINETKEVCGKIIIESIK